jgi:ABC-2 type transport system ATP-binding protein
VINVAARGRAGSLPALLLVLYYARMSSPALIIKDLKKVYKNGTEALKGVSLTVPSGDFYALLGPNGAGKTTIIGISTGLVNKSSGSVEVFGHDIDTEPETAKAHIGLVGQELNFNPFEKPIDIVVNQGGYYGVPRSEAIPRAEQLLKDLGLGEKMYGRAMELSGGMKRRLMIARALIHKPRFLVLDEPTAGVDVELRRGMWEYLRKLTAEGLTILLTTHYLEEAEQLAKHVAIIRKGDIVANGTMEEILALHDPSKTPEGYRGGKLEEVFIALTSDK